MNVAPGPVAAQLLFDPNAQGWQLLTFDHVMKFAHLVWTMWWIGVALRVYSSWKNRHVEKRDPLSQQNPRVRRRVRATGAHW